MKYAFVMTEVFDAVWAQIGYADDELRELQNELLKNPEKGRVMQGAGGFRKMRFRLPNAGKSGGVRVIYLNLPASEIIYLLMAYPKSEKADLSPSECGELKAIATTIREHYKNANKGV
ncbi:MAG: type II toxin-antitoxin system RelE/ParE family toxin [Clostridiales Family XIII bacterium]|jgi:hypothetical protein|nr:type II toxin-antitoxin system RelE/ParE family toxin [Clostridiales Family XIII bacterium]